MRAIGRTAAGVLLGSGAGLASAAGASPGRIVALAPNLTEIVFALGAGDRLVGVSEHSDYPAAAARIPVVGGLVPDLERVVALRPDLVLATTEGNAAATVEALERRRIPVLVTSAPDLEGVIDSIRRIAGRIGAGGAGERLAASLEARRAAVRRARRAGAPPTAVLLVWPSPPQAAGTGTFGDDILETAGVKNCVGRRGWPAISPEFLVEAPCRFVVYPAEKDTAATYARAFRDGPLSRMPAVRAGRTIGIDGDELTRPGPRAFDALEKLAAALPSIR